MSAFTTSNMGSIMHRALAEAEIRRLYINTDEQMSQGQYEEAWKEWDNAEEESYMKSLLNVFSTWQGNREKNKVQSADEFNKECLKDF